MGSLLCVAWQIVRPQSMDLSEVFKAKLRLKDERNDLLHRKNGCCHGLLAFLLGNSRRDS